ncbi:hypothetical protein [Streptomyces sp. Agncl-13]
MAAAPLNAPLAGESERRAPAAAYVPLIVDGPELTKSDVSGGT